MVNVLLGPSQEEELKKLMIYLAISDFVTDKLKSTCAAESAFLHKYILFEWGFFFKSNNPTYHIPQIVFEI